MNYLRALVVILLLVPSVALAQSLAPDLSIEVVPTDPRPGTTVTLSARSYSMDLNQAMLTWTYNGTSVAREMGRTSIQVVAPAAGATGTITVSVSGSESASATMVLRPGGIDLLWEAADAYTPPFYKGKALLPIGGALRLTAIPSATAPKSMSYTWQRNGSALDELSGFGKSSITLRNNAFSPQESVSVSAGTGVFAGTSSLRLNPYAPLAIAYKSSDGFVDYAQGYTSTVPITTAGAVLRFEPYYFSVPNAINADLTTTLSVNKQVIPTTVPNEIALSRPENGGQSSIDFAVTTVKYSLQNLTKTFTLLFN